MAKEQARIRRGTEEVARALEKAAGSPGTAAGSPSGAEAGSSGSKAGEAAKAAGSAAARMATAQKALEAGDLGAASERQKSALAALREAAEKLDARARELRTEREKANEELAKAERALRERAKAAAEAAKALDPQSEDAKRAARAGADALARAERAMGKAQESMGSGDPSGAAGSSEEAEQALEQAEKALSEAAKDSKDDPAVRQRLKELQEEQEKTRARLKDLQDLLAKLDNPDASSSAAGAAQKMEDASRQMQSGSGEKASKSTEDARKYLEQVKRDLEREKRRYESLRQEEMLFQLVRDLKDARKEQERIRDAVKPISDAAAATPGGRLARTQRKALQALAGDEKKLEEKLVERAKAVKEEGSPAFGSFLESTAIDAAEVARLLEEEQHDVYVRGVMDEAVREMSDLIGAFEDEIERRREEGQGGGGGGGRPPLVPPTVEIKLLRRMQMDLNARLEAFWRDNPDVRQGRVDERQRRTLERLYNQQGHIADDLDKLKKAVSGHQGN
jgi:hypothetical protein